MEGLFQIYEYLRVCLFLLYGDTAEDESRKTVRSKQSLLLDTLISAKLYTVAPKARLLNWLNRRTVP